MPTITEYSFGTLTVVLLLALGFQVQTNDTHLCRDLEITKHCDRLSSTEKTCYPLSETRLGSKYCSLGWEPINFDEPIVHGKQWICSPGGCEPVK